MGKYTHMYGGPEGSRMQIKIMTANKNITANENIKPQIKILLQIQKIHHCTQKTELEVKTQYWKFNYNFNSRLRQLKRKSRACA